MIFWYLLILVVALVNIRVCKKGFYPDYIGKEQCNAIKGLFIMLVILGHIIAEFKEIGLDFEQPVNHSAYLFYKGMGQLVVAMFLFYYGYGVMKSLLTRGNEYLVSYPKSRLLTTLLNFDIAVCLYFPLALITDYQMNWSTVLLSFIGWESLGNSNWYIFVILLCFLVFYLIFKLVRSRHFAGGILVTLILFGAMLFLHEAKNLSCWYNTILVFPAGIFFAMFSERLEPFVQKYYWLSLAALLAVFLILHFGNLRPLHGLTFNFQAIVFALLLVVLTMKVRIQNKWLIWCGISLFPLYIYHRWMMIAFRNGAGEAWVCANPHLYIGLCFFLTAAVALLYNKYLRIKLR